MGKFDRQIANAAKQIAKKGAKVTWRQVALNADNQKPWKATAAPTDYPVSILFLPATDLSSKSSRSNGGTNYIKEGDVENVSLRGLMAAVSFEPKLKDIVLMADGTPLTVSAFDVLKPDGNAIIYMVEFSE